jgi:hypothetical protein
MTLCDESSLETGADWAREAAARRNDRRTGVTPALFTGLPLNREHPA